MPCRAILALIPLLIVDLAFPAEQKPTNKWPPVLLIGDFERGLKNWTNDDAGKLELTKDAPQGKRALRWTASDDGLGKIVYRNVDRAKIDFSQYDLLKFYFKISGKPIWNLNPVVHQYPACYGYTAQYCSVDTLEGFDRWILYVQDLTKWENAWPDTFDSEKQEFRFEVAQMAGAGHTVVCLDQIELVKNTLNVKRSYRGAWARKLDGSQVTLFRVRVKNTDHRVQTVRCSAREGSLRKFRAELPADPLSLPPGEEGDLNVYVICPADVAAQVPPFYGETLLLHVKSDEAPGLELIAELTAGTKPEKLTHPVVLSNAGRQKDLRRQWRSLELRKAMPRYFQTFVKRADQALSHTPRYPLLAHPGDSTCAADETKLTKIDVPNLPFNRYQCSKCGRCYSGILYDAWAENWRGEHLKNSSAARFLGMAYGITGERHYAVKAAEIIRGYIDTYLKLPIAAPSAGSAAYSATSGAVRIGASYMSERHWLTGLAIALDFMREAEVLTEAELQQIRDRVFAPSANVMMDHKVGVMNLQWMIASAALYAGLATDDPQLVARAMYDPHGILNLVEWGYLPDGNWWENPSYQNVANGIAFPVLTTCLHAGLIPFDDRLVNVFKAAYKLCGPDGRSPTLGTGGPGSCRYSDNVVHSLASILDDPQLAWVAYNRRIWQAWSGGRQPYASFLWAAFFKSKPKVPETKAVSIFTDKTVLFPDYGGLAMRVPKTDMYCYLEFGRHKVHGHYNKLSINAYGKGGWFVRNVMGGYRDAFKEYLEPVSGSSTIMVDGQNQDSDTGELLFHKSTPLGELASAREMGAWKDVEHERSCILTPSVLVVIDRCRSDQEHTYDWLWHGSLTKLKYRGTFDKIGPVSSLGDAKCYPFFLPATERALPWPGSQTGKFILHQRPKAGTGVGITFCRPQEHGGRHFHTENRGKHDGLILRKRGKTVSFACLMEPLAKDPDPVALIDRIELLDAQTDQPAGLDRAQGCRVQTREGTLVIVVNYSGTAIKAKGGLPVPSTDRIWITEAE